MLRSGAPTWQPRRSGGRRSSLSAVWGFWPFCWSSKVRGCWISSEGRAPRRPLRRLWRPLRHPPTAATHRDASCCSREATTTRSSAPHWPTTIRLPESWLRLPERTTPLSRVRAGAERARRLRRAPNQRQRPSPSRSSSARRRRTPSRSEVGSSSSPRSRRVSAAAMRRPSRRACGSTALLLSRCSTPRRGSRFASGYYVVYTGPFATLREVQRSAAHVHAFGYRTAYIREILRY